MGIGIGTAALIAAGTASAGAAAYSIGKNRGSDSDAQQAPKTVTDTTAAPTGPTADVNKQLVEKQGADRRKRLLFESTGRPSPTGPSIQTQTSNQRTLL